MTNMQAVKEEIDLTPSLRLSPHSCSGNSLLPLISPMAGDTWKELRLTDGKDREVQEPYLPSHLMPQKNTQCLVSPRSVRGPHRLPPGNCGKLTPSASPAAHLRRPALTEAACASTLGESCL